MLVQQYGGTGVRVPDMLAMYERALASEEEAAAAGQPPVVTWDHCELLYLLRCLEVRGGWAEVGGLGGRSGGLSRGWGQGAASAYDVAQPSAPCTMHSSGRKDSWQCQMPAATVLPL